MDKLLTIENIIKYLPLPAFVAKDGEIVLKNELAKNIELSGFKDKLLCLDDEGGSLMWEEVINAQKCSIVAWKTEEYIIITVSSMVDGVSCAARKISRGIREPLGSLHACTRRIMTKLDDDDPASDEYCAAMAHNLYKLMRLTGNLDTLAGADGYDFSLKEKNTDIKELIKNLVENSRPYVKALKKQIEYKLPSVPVLSMADSVLLESALGNLIENSLRYTGENTSICVKLDILFNNMVITVSDDGSGMSPEKLQRVAAMKYEWQDLSEMFSSSAGMGLLMARFAADAHGGTMMIQSREGSGTSVILSIPLKRSACMSLSTQKITIKPDFLSPLVMFADILPRESYMYLEI